MRSLSVVLIAANMALALGCDAPHTGNTNGGVEQKVQTNSGESKQLPDNTPPLCASKSDIDRLHNTIVRLVGTYTVVDAGKTEVAQVSIGDASVIIDYGVSPEDAQAYGGKKVEIIGRVTRDYVDPNDENTRFMQRLVGPHLHSLQSIQLVKE